MSELALARPFRRSGSVSTRRGSHWLAHVVLVLGGITMVFTFIWQLILSVSTQAEAQSATPTLPTKLQWSTYGDVFQQLPFMHQFWVSVLITVIRTGGQLLLCSLAGYAFARMPFRGRGPILACILSILMVPSQAFLLPQYQIVEGLGWLNTVQGIVAPGLFSAFGTFLMRQFFLTIPAELDDAATVDGASRFRIFWEINLPLAKPALAVLAVFTITYVWNDFLWPLIMLNDRNLYTITLGLSAFRGGIQSQTFWAELMAGATMAVAPLIIIFFFTQRFFTAGISFTGTGGR